MSDISEAKARIQAMHDTALEEHIKWFAIHARCEEEEHGKTREEVRALSEYFEGKVDGFVESLRLIRGF